MEDSLVPKQSHVTCNSWQPIECCLATEIYADMITITYNEIMGLIVLNHCQALNAELTESFLEQT